MNSQQRQQRKSILLDASSAILLAKAGFHEMVAASYTILMSESVFDEITRKRLFGSDEYERLQQEKRLEVLPVLNPTSWSVADASLQRLDRGERDLLILFREGRGDFVVTDDGSAARFCLSSRVPFVNSLLMLRLLQHSGMIRASSYETGFQSLLALGRYSEKIREYARSCPDSELRFFLP
jgi:predicted nucleic acid-binding protein